MVFISEISKEGGVMQLELRDRVEEGGVRGDGGIVLDSQNAAAEVVELLSEGGSVAVENSLDGADVSAGKPLYNENALRVAYIMRSYLYTRPGSGNGDVGYSGEVSGGVDRCRAMMEVVRKESGRWLVSKVVLEHPHSLAPPPDPAGTVAGGRLVPSVGMEFDSISMAKAFYYTYSEKMGFKARTGSGQRSRGNRILVMQRFLCSKANYTFFGKPTVESTVKKKRGPYRKRTSNTRNEDNLDSAVEIVLGDSAEKAAVVGDEMAIEGQRSQLLKIATFEEKDGMTKGSASVSDLGNVVSTVGMDGQKVPFGGIPAQSRLLRELGIRVSRYTNEERRDIILRYMRKRNNRQVVDRSTKVPSRQALAERRQRGFGGKFLSKEDIELQALSKPQETVDDEPEVPPEVAAKAGGVPMVGMGFDSEEKAYEYYANYAANIGFSVRKGLWDKSAKNITRSRIYVCSREVFRAKNAASEMKKSWPEARTGCHAKMVIKATSLGRYRVTEFVADHSHQLALPLDIQILKSQRLLSNAQNRNHQNADLIPAGYKNYIRSKRIRAMKVGDARIILEYFQKMKECNPSFYYGIQVDEDDKMTNVFWADARSIMDYYYFGDAVCFHTPYKTDVYDKPLVLFIGVNHHKQAVIFGSAFLYDETRESFKWLFEIFQNAMAGKRPKTIFTDQCTELDDAIAAIWPDTAHRLCTWQLYQHAFKHLNEFFQVSESFLQEFCRCMFDFEEEEEFLAAWSIMLEKYNLKENEWLQKIYEKKEKWAPAYSRDTFCADLQSSLRGECLNDFLKELLNHDADLSYFFRQYEKLLEEKHSAELQADYNADQDILRIPLLRMLWQAANIYTPAVFEIFRTEFELFMNCVVCCSGEVGILSEYEVTLKGKTRAHFVRFDSSDGTVLCSCKKFVNVGIQCCHVLKVLDFRDIKELPQQFFLKRWRKDAKSGSLRDNEGLPLHNNPNLSMMKRYNSLCQILYRIAERAAENMDAFTLIAEQSDQLVEQVERILQTKLLEKPPINNALKGQLQIPTEIQNSLDDNSEALKVKCKKRKDAIVPRRQQGRSEVNKRHKLNKGQSEECDVAARELEPPLSNVIPQINSSNQFIPPSHFMQGPYVTNHQFGLTNAQAFHAITQFGQDSASVLQQPFHGSSHLNQSNVPGYPTPEMHALQFVGSNPQLDHQGSDQGHCNIPVWDFL